MSESDQSIVSMPITFKSETYFLVVGRFALHAVYGPYPTLERARSEAAMLLATQVGVVFDVMKCVGSVTKEVPAMSWTTPDAE